MFRATDATPIQKVIEVMNGTVAEGKEEKHRVSASFKRDWLLGPEHHYAACQREGQWNEEVPSTTHLDKLGGRIVWCVCVG